MNYVILQGHPNKEGLLTCEIGIIASTPKAVYLATISLVLETEPSNTEMSGIEHLGFLTPIRLLHDDLSEVSFPPVFRSDSKRLILKACFGGCSTLGLAENVIPLAGWDPTSQNSLLFRTFSGLEDGRTESLDKILSSKKAVQKFDEFIGWTSIDKNQVEDALKPKVLIT